MRFPFAADPFQPGRALLAALVFLAAALVVDGDVVRRVRWEFAPLAIGAALVVLSGLLNGADSALYGVHGRYLGWVTGVVLVISSLIGAFVMGRDVRFFTKAVAVSAAVQTGVILFDTARGAGGAGLTGNSVLSGGWLAVATGLLVAAALVWPRRTRAWLIAAATFAALGVIASGSRGAVVGAVVGAALAVVVTRPARTRRVWALGVAAAGVIAVTGIALAASASGALTSGSTGSRIEIWRATTAMIGEHPLEGVGPGRFLYVYPAFDTLTRARLEPGVRADQAHNEILQLAAEAGVPAALAVAAFFGVALIQAGRAAVRSDASAVIVAGGLGAVVGYSAFGITTVEIGVLGWILAGMAIARGALLREPSGSHLTAWRRTVSGLIVAGACAAAVASGLYLRADRAYLAGLTAFEAADFVTAGEQFATAVTVSPTVDVYRVAFADAALYGDPASLADTLQMIDEGLRREPASYDLVMQRARVLSAQDVPPMKVVQTYLRAVELYPLDSQARASAAAMLRSAGDEAAARALETEAGR